MEDVFKKHLRKEIIDILKAADLSVLSSKKVREQVEAKLGTSLSSRKKEVDKIVMRFINNESDSEDSYSNNENNLLKDSAEKKLCNEVSTKGLSLKSLAKTDEKLFKERKKAKKKNEDVTLRKSTGFTRPYTLSPELADIMGAKSLPRHEVVKKVWSIIKERNLYDPKNKQFAFCDDELIKVMKVKRFRTFGMLKYLKAHFIE